MYNHSASQNKACDVIVLHADELNSHKNSKFSSCPTRIKGRHVMQQMTSFLCLDSLERASVLDLGDDVTFAELYDVKPGALLLCSLRQRCHAC